MGVKVTKVIVGDLQENCYIVYDEEERNAVIVDPGDGAKSIIDVINNLKIKPEVILLTHGHFDHTSAVEELREVFEMPVYLNEEDLKMINKYCDGFNSIGNDNKIDYLVKDGEIILTSTFKINCIGTPGHTPGGMCYLVEDILLSGDTLFNGAIGRWDFPGGNFEVLVNAIKKKLFSLGTKTRVLPGHGPETTIGKEMRDFIY